MNETEHLGNMPRRRRREKIICPHERGRSGPRARGRNADAARKERTQIFSFASKFKFMKGLPHFPARSCHNHGACPLVAVKHQKKEHRKFERGEWDADRTDVESPRQLARVLQHCKAFSLNNYDLFNAFQILRPAVHLSH